MKVRCYYLLCRMQRLELSFREVTTILTGRRSIIGVAVVCLISLSCAKNGRQRIDAFEGEVQVDLDRGNDRQLLAFYVGGMVSEAGSDPFSAGVVEERAGKFYLDITALSDRTPGLASLLTAAGADGVIEWEEFERAVAESYNVYREIPPTLDSLRSQIGDWSDDTRWFGFKVDGVMSPNTRQIRISIDELAEAIRLYRDHGERILYREGTTFVSEHLIDDRVVEVSVMSKRRDGFWDFYAYGEDGAAISVVERSPSDLIVPTRCVGCHFGNRLFEPERSFPVDPSPGPDGPRKLHVVGDMKNTETVAALDEHRKRSDAVLGLYATLFVSHLQSMRRTGNADPEWVALLDQAGF